MFRCSGILVVACVGLGCQADLTARLLGESASMALASAEVSSEPLQRFSYERDLLGVRASVLLWAADQERAFAAADAAFDRAQRLERLASVWDEGSELAQLNRALAVPGSHPVSADLAAILNWSRERAARCYGAFEPTVGALLEAQGYYDEEGEPRSPGRDALAALREIVGPDAWRIEPAPEAAAPPLLHARAGLVWPGWRIAEHRVVTELPGVRFDLGAVLKGLAADSMAATLRQRGLDRALINLGASTVLALEAPPGEEGWVYRIRLADTEQEWLLNQRAVSVSEQLGQPVFLDGRLTSHIVDPRTLKPVDHEVLKAVVLHRSAAAADAYSTDRSGGGLRRRAAGVQGPRVPRRRLLLALQI
ncbi:MAG: FAD:protein FMN transferase [Planctomycetota bacterium]|jgi:thiamine biosynthesis lipoprotein